MTSTESLQTLHNAFGQHAESADLPYLLAQWRHGVVLAPLAILPPTYDQVRHSLLQRLDMAVSFGEESCSFSPPSLLAEMRPWMDKAKAKFANM